MSMSHEHRIEYFVDDELQVTDNPELTPNEILTRAGLDADLHYLKCLNPPRSYESEPTVPIHIHNHERFISVAKVPTTVS